MSEDQDLVRFDMDVVSKLANEAGMKLLNPELKVSRLLFVVHFLNQVFQKKTLFNDLQNMFRFNSYSKELFVRNFASTYCSNWRSASEEKALKFFKKTLETLLESNSDIVLYRYVMDLLVELQDVQVKLFIPSWLDPSSFVPKNIMN